MFKVVENDLFTSKEKYIVHQVNCVTIKASYLAYHMFKRFPHSDVYSFRSHKDVPGDIIIRGDGEGQRYVIALLGQYFPGSVRYFNSKKDGIKARQNYFYQGLWKIAQIPSLESVAFPHGIGCGVAGGDWDTYYRILQNFAEYLKDTADVYIYHNGKRFRGCSLR